MHEVSIMSEVLEQAQEVARRNNAAQIHAIRLRIGALSGVVAESLEFAFEALRPGTLASQARLEIERIPANFHCDGCGRDLARHEADFLCPACQEPLRLTGGGRELELADLEIS